eukprot:CAMPEP_0180767136 /NCGR_PEP_ID=MMETSP1038_2-20121128/39860_1 /TAXON_ID=632150 /ORGANISM="Azadinium spinosum, Strain 3D9" /LENGTH=82 /DNA_ID=CAMNT_0022801679 /DNA_START=480 /DNA_END=725 /DNA_ORIENTATION=-
MSSHLLTVCTAASGCAFSPIPDSIAEKPCEASKPLLPTAPAQELLWWPDRRGAGTALNSGSANARAPAQLSEAQSAEVPRRR